MSAPTKIVDDRWTDGLNGFGVLAFVERNKAPVPAEVTGVDGFFVFVVVDGEEKPRRMFWCDIRPAAPGDRVMRSAA